MKFTRIEDAIDVCKKHLVASGSLGTEIESFLVRYLLVVVCAEYERCVEKLFSVRATRSGDAHLIRIMDNWAHMAIKRMRIGDLTKHLESFGDDYKDAFQKKTMNTPASVSYSNIQVNRNEVAHVVGPVMTLADFERDFAASKDIIVAVAEVLGMTAAEMATLTWA